MRFARSSLVALTLALAALAPAAFPDPASAGPLPDTTGILTSWRLEPASPCVQDSVFMIVRGFVATPCDSFLGAEALTPLHVRIRTQVHADRRCFAPPSIFYPVPVALGRFSAGPHWGIVEVETVQRFGDGTTTTLVQQYRFDFVVSAECSIPPPPAPGPLPYVQSIGTEPPRACAGTTTRLVMRGVFNDGCGRVIDAYVRDPQHVELTLKPDVLADTACTLALQPWTQSFDLGALPSGPHRTDITLHLVRRDSAGTGFVRETHYGSHEFFVYGDCDSIPPLPGLLPYVRGIRVGYGGICGIEPICPGDSIPVLVSGVFPNDCFSLRDVQLIPPLETVFPPPPPTVRLIVDTTGCQRRLCREVPVPWSAAVRLPPMLGGDYHLRVELALVSCSDSYPPGELHRASVPFTVQAACPEPVPCLIPDFIPRAASPNGCNVTVSKLQPAELTFLVAPSVALAGLQGTFRLGSSALQVTRIETTGPAEGMFLDWTATADGARFVMFAPSGAPIPAWVGQGPTPGEPAGWPVLRITVASVSRADLPRATVLTAERLLGSDLAGGAVIACPPVWCPARDPSFIPGQAIICAESPCDFNADGLQDVRDLVLMVQCVNEPTACPPDAATRHDCDGDGSFALADVLCCARHVLQRPSCPDCPPDTGQVRPEPGVAVTLGAPEEVGGAISLPVQIAGADRLGGMMLTLEAPLDRYDVTGFAASPPGGWLALHEVRDGRIVLGLIDVHDGRQLDLRVSSNFTLELALRPGQPPGGEVAAVSGEFSGPDGVALGVDLGRPSQLLPGSAPVMLGANRPNPFSAETEFTLQVAQAGEALVGIYDLRGRRVATLHRAPLAAGAHRFRWDGRDAEGTAAPNGVYFYQATVEGRSVARKLILMRGD